ncbi:MAG: PIG-L family deacetylase [Planctomycetes bacterium]|nr:PIG-L family deacetylase [Planctomycetota bacterium]
MAKTILAVGAHADDCEIGAGGVLLQAVQAGCRVVTVVVVSDYSTWAATKGREADTKERMFGIAKKYGYEKRFLDYPYHVIDGGDLDLKQKLAKIYNELRPEVCFVHHDEDHFPDHMSCGHAAKAACLFAHGLSGDLNAPRIKRVLAYTVTPWQTYRFEPDVFYDVTATMPPYMDLLNELDAAYVGKQLGDVVAHEVKDLRHPERNLRLGGHALTKYADCVQHGSRAGSLYANGFKHLWGPRWGEQLW